MRIVELQISLARQNLFSTPFNREKLKCDFKSSTFKNKTFFGGKYFPHNTYPTQKL